MAEEVFFPFLHPSIVISFTRQQALATVVSRLFPFSSCFSSPWDPTCQHQLDMRWNAPSPFSSLFAFYSPPFSIPLETFMPMSH